MTLSAVQLVGPAGGWQPQTRVSQRWVTVVALALCADVALLAYYLNTSDYDTWGGFLIGPLIVLISVPLLRRAATGDNTFPNMFGFLMVAMVVKLASAVVRNFVTTVVYDGAGDAEQYSDVGKHLAVAYRSFDFSVEVGKRVPGTGFIRVVAGAVYSFIGPTKLGAFFVFSWLGFWGLYFFYRAFCIAVPTGNRRRYAVLVFLLPSLLFWPSSIGKEAWMTFSIGLACYGAARVLDSRRGGWPIFLLGLAATMGVRPHISALVFGGTSLAFFLRRSKHPNPLTPVLKASGLAVLAVVGVVVLNQFQGFFEDPVQQKVLQGTEILDYVERQTEQKGSAYDARRPTGPFDYPAAAFSVLFRPMPHEADNTQMFITSLEGVVLLGLTVTSWRRLVAIPGAMLRTPYVALCVAYSAGFLYAFSAVGNFGILARQRVQVLPFFLVFLCLAPRRRRFDLETLQPIDRPGIVVLSGARP